jgi:hypothetical protein
VIGDLISSKREHIQSLQVVKAITDFSNIVGIKREVLKLGQLVKALNCLDLVE